MQKKINVISYTFYLSLYHFLHKSIKEISFLKKKIFLLLETKLLYRWDCVCPSVCLLSFFLFLYHSLFGSPALLFIFWNTCPTSFKHDRFMLAINKKKHPLLSISPIVSFCSPYPPLYFMHSYTPPLLVNFRSICIRNHYFV